MDILDNTELINKNNQIRYATDVLSNKTLILLFTAKHVNENDKLLELLKQMYEEGRKRKIKLAVVFISLDESEEIMMKHFIAHGNWLAVPHNSLAALELIYKYSVTSIPRLIVVRHDGTVITQDGREELKSIGINVLITWTD